MFRKYRIEVDSLTLILIRLFIALVFFSFSRILLLYSNSGYFGEDSGFFESIPLIAAGLRFDLSGLFMLNLPFILLSSVPFPLKKSKYYIFFTLCFYYLGNISGLALNFIDTVYFPFNLKRLTGDIFGFLAAGDNFWPLLPQFLIDFWKTLVLFILTVSVFVLINNHIHIRKKQVIHKLPVFVFKNSLLMLVWMGVSIVAIRGGFQLKPLSLISAGRVTEAKFIPVILNTPFSIIKTLNQKGISEKNYFSDPEQLKQLYNPEKSANNLPVHGSQKPLNVVILIMESFSGEHSAYLNKNPEGTGFTPFFDSLAKCGRLFYGYANGKRSIEGIPAIVSSLPALMDQDFITSVYAGNKINSIAGLLRKTGYKTTFYHGGNNGTMGFDSYAKIAGFEYYKGRNEYNNDADFDGKWGIFDEPFFKYVVNDLNKQKPPFLGVVFSLSSHHPYTIPNHLKGRFRKGNLPIQQSIMYADYALRHFFADASKNSWFTNTLFVITADHASEAFNPVYQTRTGQYAVPVLFYQPGSTLRGYSHQVVQQTDIMPTVLNYLNYNQKYVAFGRDVINDSTNGYAINYLSGDYQFITDEYSYLFDDKVITACYAYKTDSLLRNNLARHLPTQARKDEDLMKAIIQQYNYRIINNKLTPEQ